jgi:chromosome segregation ATPase
LARIRNDRVNVQNQLATLSNNAQRIGQDLQQAERNVQAAESIYRKREAERNQMNIFADNTRRSIDSNTASQTELRRSVEADRTEIANNNSRLAQIDRDFAGYQNRSNQLNQEIPVVSQQISSLETQVSGADSNYRQRLTLFQRYLGEAQTLGNSRGNAAGQTDGSKAGLASMNTIASRLGIANGSEEGRFEALLRAFVRSEIAGFNTGRTQGLASAADASRGTQEGTATGTRDHP